MKYFILRRAFTAASIFTCLCLGIAFAATATSLKGLMYVGTLDRKLLVINEDSGDIVGEIPLGGIPRTTVLSADKTKVHVVTTEMEVETVDLASQQGHQQFPSFRWQELSALDSWRRREKFLGHRRGPRWPLFIRHNLARGKGTRRIQDRPAAVCPD